MCTVMSLVRFQLCCLLPFCVWVINHCLLMKQRSHDWYVWRMSLLDSCHVVRTANLHVYWPLARFPQTVGKCDTNWRSHQYLFTYQCVTCCFPATGLYKIAKWLVCRQYYLVRPTNPDRVHEVWKRDHNDQATIWRVCPSTNVCPDKPVVKTVSQFCAWLRVHWTVTGEFGKYTCRGSAALDAAW